MTILIIMEFVGDHIDILALLASIGLKFGFFGTLDLGSFHNRPARQTPETA